MRAYHHQHPQTPTIDVGQMTKMQNVNMTLRKSRVYLLIDTVLSVRFDLGRKKRRVPNNLGQQWPVRLSPIPQKIKEANVRQCIAPPLLEKKGLSVHCGCHGDCRSCWTCQLCIGPSSKLHRHLLLLYCSVVIIGEGLEKKSR